VVYFTGDLCLEETRGETDNGRALWQETGSDPLVFHDDDGNTITFGHDCTTDLGSTPQFSWSLGFPPDGIGVRAYTIHDLLYRTRGDCLWLKQNLKSRKAPYSRAEADEILRKGLIVCGVPRWRARIIWLAVRLGGADGWGR
jgi:hypothetical protein